MEAESFLQGFFGDVEREFLSTVGFGRRPSTILFAQSFRVRLALFTQAGMLLRLVTRASSSARCRPFGKSRRRRSAYRLLSRDERISGGTRLSQRRRARGRSRPLAVAVRATRGRWPSAHGGNAEGGDLSPANLGSRKVGQSRRVAVEGNGEWRFERYYCCRVLSIPIFRPLANVKRCVSDVCVGEKVQGKCTWMKKKGLDTSWHLAVKSS